MNATAFSRQATAPAARAYAPERRSRAWMWGAALALSGLVHAGTATYFLHGEPEQIAIAGGGATELTVVGSAFTEQTAAGEVTEVVDPVEEAVAEATPVEAETVAAEPVEAASTVVVETLKPQPSQPLEAAEAVEQPEEMPAETVEPVEPTEEIAALPEIPVPTPRPDYTPPPEPKKAASPARKAPERREAKKAPQKPKTAGSGGRDTADTKQGTADGAARARAARQGDPSRQASAAGNAAVSNYPGKVRSKLSRALRSVRRGQSGEVHVRFTVTRSGGVSGIGVSRSSGSPALDKAAIDTVRRAAPFPAIPQAAGRSSWNFTIPLSFN